MKRALTALLGLFPSPFLQRFGAEMRDQIERDTDAAFRRGWGAAALYGVRTAIGIVVAAALEHTSPTWTRSGANRRGNQPMNVDHWTHDVRHAVRSLWRARGFTLAVVATLGLAMGVNTGIFSVIQTVLLDPLPIRDADRLVHIAASAPGSDFPPEFRTSNEFFVHYGENASGLENLATYNSFTSTLRAGDRVERVRMSAPTPSLFETLGVEAALGRTPTVEDGEQVVVLSHGLWQDWFGGAEDILGERISVSGEMRTVLGVMPEDFWFPRDDVTLWYSNIIRAEDVVAGRFGNNLVGRVAPGVTEEGLRQELLTLARQLPERFGGSANYARLIEQHQPVVRPMEEELLGEIASPLWMLLGAVGLVLLIACANVANLLLVRAERRQADLALRKAVGASRFRLITGQLAESFVLSLVSGVVAMIFAFATIPLLVRSAPARIPRIEEVSVGVQTLLFAFALSIAVAMICGLLPAVRGSVPNLARLREGGRGATGRHWGRHALVVGQTALALVLLIGSGLLLRSTRELQRVDPGYDTENIFSFQIAPESPSLTDAASFAEFHLDFMDRLRGLPGVEMVGLVENLPLDEGTAGIRVRREDEVEEEGAGTRVQYTWAAGDYFQAMGIEQIAGRNFTVDEHRNGRGSVIISQSAADRLFPGRDPIGGRIGTDGESWDTVVGVVDDVLQQGFASEAAPMVYLPLTAMRPISSPAYVLRSSRAADLAPDARALVREYAPNAPMYRVYTMQELASRSMLGLFFTMSTMAVAAGLALLLGAIGLYGVLSYLVAERRREIGVRMAMGAAPGAVQWMVIKQGVRVVALGLVIGLVASFFGSRALGDLLFQVSTVDPWTYAGMSLALLAIGAVSVYLPARRASGVDPVRSLRAD